MAILKQDTSDNEFVLLSVQKYTSCRDNNTELVITVKVYPSRIVHNFYLLKNIPLVSSVFIKNFKVNLYLLCNYFSLYPILVYFCTDNKTNSLSLISCFTIAI